VKIIPASPYKTNSKAEYRIFDKLRESFVNNNKYLAFHSLNLTRHETKKFGEADFVIVCEFGVFVLEVKGGRISVENGVWYTINRNNEKYRIQNPFKQAESALHAIKNEIQGFNKLNHLRLPIGYGVLFPDVEWTQQGSEWDIHTICDSRRMKNFEPWLKKFFSYWQNKPGNFQKLSIENIKVLQQFLRPNFELIEPLFSKLSKLEKATVELTKDQYKYLDIVAANSKVLCSGGAGTGKTFLAAELARRMASENKNIALICKSNWLKRHLEAKIINEFVTISTIDSSKVDMKRSGINEYDVLIVDEGQDLFNIDDIDVLDNILNGGLKDGEWYIFHDINNQSGLFFETKLEMLKMLESYTPAKIPLTTNCRNSAPILKKVQEILHLDMGNKGTGKGPKVIEIIKDNKNDRKMLQNQINEMLQKGVSPGSITILSPFCYEDSSVNDLPKKIKKNIVKLDDFVVRSFPLSQISFSEILNFKGLENEVIIVIDLEHPKIIKKNFNKTHHYIAMSRARALLCTIWNNNESFR
jgi:hypothetical protein